MEEHKFPFKGFETANDILEAILGHNPEFSPSLNDIESGRVEDADDEGYYVYSYNQAIKVAQEYGEIFEGLGEIIDVYRVIGVGNINDIDWEYLGNHWTFMKDIIPNLINNLGISGSVVFCGKIHRDNVDWEETFRHYNEFSGSYTDEDENEITITDDHFSNFNEVKCFLFQRKNKKWTYTPIEWGTGEIITENVENNMDSSSLPFENCRSIEEISKRILAFNDEFLFTDDEQEYKEYEDSFLFSYSEAMEIIQDSVDIFLALGERFNIYRVISVKDINDIDWDKIGQHWTYEEDNLATVISLLGLYKRNSEIVVFSATVERSQVDWPATFRNYIIFSHNSGMNSSEKEITIKRNAILDDERCFLWDKIDRNKWKYREIQWGTRE